MLKFNLDRAFKARGITNPTRFLKKAGFAPSYVTSITHKRVQSISFKYLERFCILLHCSPNDLLEWFPSEEYRDDQKHPLNELIRNRKLADLSKVIHSIPINKLEKLETLILESGLVEKD